MCNIEIGKVIAERVFEIQDGCDRQETLTLRIGQPISDPKAISPENPDWCCPYEIVGLSQKPRAIYGIDALQALLGSMQVISAELIAFQQRYGCKLTWLGEDDWGLPTLDFSTLENSEG